MSTEELLELSHQSQQAKQRMLMASTLAFATVAGLASLTDIPTYVPPIPPAFMSELSVAEHASIVMNKLIFSIRSYGSFEKNWDGYNGQPPSKEAIKDTINFLKQLPNITTLPISGLSGDGEINLFWDKDGNFIDIGFTGDGKYSYYARKANGEEDMGNYISLSDQLPANLINSLKTIKP